MRQFFYPVTLILLGLVACASTYQEYPRYVVWPSHDLLEAHEPKDDLRLSSTCEPDEQDKARCILLKREVFYKMEAELLQLREALKECQAGPMPTKGRP